VVGLAPEEHARPAHPDDGVDHTDGDPGFFQARPLLDVKLDVRRHRARGRLGLGRPGRIEPGAPHGVGQALAIH
jgi:hypothetical protein